MSQVGSKQQTITGNTIQHGAGSTVPVSELWSSTGVPSNWRDEHDMMMGFLTWNPKRHLNFQGFVFGLFFCKSRYHVMKSLSNLVEKVLRPPDKSQQNWPIYERPQEVISSSSANPAHTWTLNSKYWPQSLGHATPALSLRETGSIWVRPCWPLKSQQNGQAYLTAPGTRTSLHDLVCSQQGRLSKGKAQWLNRIFLRMAF